MACMPVQTVQDSRVEVASMESSIGPERGSYSGLFLEICLQRPANALLSDNGSWKDSETILQCSYMKDGVQ